MTAGRPTKYKTEFASQARKLTQLGALDTDLAEFFQVDVSTISLWKNKHKKFSEAIKEGKGECNDRVRSALYQRATGYNHPDTYFANFQGQIIKEEFTKHVPPDVRAIQFWLMNRERDQWTEAANDGANTGPITLNIFAKN